MVNGNRRSDIEIVHEILTLTREGIRKTEILYQGKLSYTQLQSYLSFLLSKNLVEEEMVHDNGSPYRLYKLTRKGSTVLSDIERVITHLR
jgi:predicted transcriptional regulator